MRIAASVISHPGNHREKNEDNFIFNRIILDDSKSQLGNSGGKAPEQSIIMGVFDGMGGISAGEVASLITAQTAYEMAPMLSESDNIPATLVSICEEANRRVCNEMVGVVRKRMGTTATMICFSRGNYYLCNVGDSPAFLLRDSVLEEISHEHTEKDNYIQIYGEENLPPNKKYRLTQHVGIFPDEMIIDPYIRADRLVPGDKFIICSDGLTDMVPRDEITQILSSSNTPKEMTEALLQRALYYGGKDNVTIVYAQVSKA
ncbi:MAG: serine/threonine-protein phosphatase [Ruminococcus sp.]|nr:serine/threonine-protein phosphatase [Ruminococcus sp.]